MIKLIAAVLPFACVMSVTPGPNNLMLAASGANFGVLRTLPHIIGIVIGFPIMLLLVGLGAKPVFEQAPVLHLVLKILGALYLLYLPYRTATAAAPDTEQGRSAKPLTFLQAAVFQWVNPKAWVIAVGATTTYTSLHGDMVRETLLIAATFAVRRFRYCCYGQAPVSPSRNSCCRRIKLCAPSTCSWVQC